MAVESAADRASFLDTDEFGDAATYTPNGGSATSVNGVFDLPHRSLDFSDVAVSDRRPTFWCRSADLPGTAAGGDAGDRLVVDGTTFRVLTLEPDGQGMTLVTLGKNS